MAALAPRRRPDCLVPFVTEAHLRPFQFRSIGGGATTLTLIDETGSTLGRALVAPDDLESLGLACLKAAAEARAVQRRDQPPTIGRAPTTVHPLMRDLRLGAPSQGSAA